MGRVYHILLDCYLLLAQMEPLAEFTVTYKSMRMVWIHDGKVTNLGNQLGA
jgi:hypothetical protein